ncbi:NHL repeat containing protein [Oopsacas minuta]|uniref:NHL repeat containing protein n=1 Tax=Oopsacas minuta TaxID=111878 RepID=A0AAV7KJF3_9METZ|nr:NHL repeat containing protein [Oopsacas minuta]
MATSESGRDSNFLEFEKKVQLLIDTISEIFSELIEMLKKREETLLNYVNSLKREFEGDIAEQKKIEEDCKEFDNFKSKVKSNPVTDIITGSDAKIEEKLDKIRSESLSFDYIFKTNKLDNLKSSILNFGSLQPTFRDYSSIKKSKRSFGTLGTDEGPMECPHGLAVDSNDRIFVACGNKHCIFVFTIEGQFLGEFGQKYLSQPWGVCCVENKLFVTDHKLHCIFAFELINFTKCNVVGELGLREGQLKSPTMIDYDSSTKELYVADYLNNRIAIYNIDLTFKRFFLDQSTEGPICIKVTEQRVFILECRTPNLRSYAKDGTDQKNIYSIEEVLKSNHFFTADNHENCIISDYKNNCISVINPRGEQKTIGGPGTLTNPTGICLSHSENEIIVVTRNKDNPIVIF